MHAACFTSSFVTLCLVEFSCVHSSSVYQTHRTELTLRSSLLFVQLLSTHCPFSFSISFSDLLAQGAMSHPSDRTLFSLPGMLSTGIRKSLQTLFCFDHRIVGPPKLPPELERQIFETCARSNREACLRLMLVARRVQEWYVLREL